MGKKIMLINVHEDETRIAMSENGVLMGLHMQQTARERKVGNIYRGTIVKVNPAFQAAFVDYGESRNGFLSISDVNFELFKPKDREKGRPRIQSLLKEGQQVTVQILKEGVGNKGSAMTTFVSLAGRFMVINPHSDRSGVSRKIEDRETRQRLKEMMESLSSQDDLGLIIRTAGMDRPIAELKKDLESLRKEWKAIQAKYDKLKKPGMLYSEPSPIVRILRDYYTDEVEEVWVDDPEGFAEALRYFKSTMPQHQKRLKLYVGDKSLFSAYRVEEQIEMLGSSKVGLKSGGSLVIESTEALVSVDVNSGRSNQASDIEETALNTNLEAADEVARQLRLRNLGGLIVVDFIDMFEARNRKKVEQTTLNALRGDKARTTVGTISQFGLLELSRQRIDMEFSSGLRHRCPNCGGTGHIPTVVSAANDVLRKIREMAAGGKYGEIYGDLPLESANFLHNEKREALRDLELEFEITINLTADSGLPDGSPIVLRGGGKHAGEAQGEEDEVSLEEDGGDERPRRRRRRGRGGRGETPAAETRREEESSFPDAVAAEGAWEATEEEAGVSAATDQTPTQAAEEDQAPAPKESRHSRGRGRRERGPAPERSGRAGPVSTPSRDGANGSGSQLEFRSEHIMTNPEAVKKLPPRITRSKPFAALEEQLAPNTVVFDSNSLAAAPEAGTVAEADAPAPKKSSGGGRRPGRRGQGKKSGAGASQETGPEKTASAPRKSGAGKTAKADGATPAKKTRQPRPRTGAGRGRKPAQAQEADGAASS